MFELVFEEGRGFPPLKGALLEQVNGTEFWKSNVSKGSRVVWSGWSLEFKIDKAGR